MLDFKKIYKDFECDECKQILFDFLSENYGLNDVVLYLNSGEEIIIEKYNVVGFSDGFDGIRIYECGGELKTPLHIVTMDNIDKLSIVLV